MDQLKRQQLVWLERRCRTTTGFVLAVLALAACYGLLFFEGQMGRSSTQHFYPWMVAVLFYCAGDLLAYIWFKVVSVRLEMIKEEVQQAWQRGMAAGSSLAEEDTDSGVEVVRPTEQES
jgi:hypothetical protein